MTKKTGICILVAVCLLCLAVVDMHADTSARRKARYYYTAGMVEKAVGNEDSAYEYFKRAYNIDPDYAEAAIAYGMARLEIPLDTLQSDTEVARSLAMMRQFVDKYPDDVNESQYYGYVATQLGDMDEAVRVLERTYSQHPKATATLLQLSDAYAYNNELDKAVDAIDRYERNEGLSPQVTTRKVSYLLASKDTVRAVREVSRLVASEPRNVSYTILKGNVFDVIQQKDSALFYYRKAEEIDPESGAAKFALSQYYKEAGDSAAYDTKMYEVLLCEDLDSDMKSDILADYLQALIKDKRDTRRGDYLFSVLRDQYPHEPRVLDLAARYLAAKGDYVDAQEQISYALDRDPTNTVYWGQLMTYLVAQDKYDESIEAYERAKTHVEPDENLRLYYSLVAQLAKRYDLAAEVYRDMIREVQENLDPDKLLTLKDVRRDISLGELDFLASSFISLGDIYHLAGENEKSYTMYENALVFDPSSSLAANNYAYFLSIDGGDLDKALQLIKKVIQGEDGKNPTYLDTYAWINFKKGDYVTALEYQEKAIAALEKNSDSSAEIYDHYGDILEKLNRLPEALSQWKRAAAIMEETNSTDEEDYGKILAKIEKWKPLVEQIEKEKAKESEK